MYIFHLPYFISAPELIPFIFHYSNLHLFKSIKPHQSCFYLLTVYNCPYKPTLLIFSNPNPLCLYVRIYRNQSCSSKPYPDYNFPFDPTLIIFYPVYYYVITRIPANYLKLNLLKLMWYAMWNVIWYAICWYYSGFYVYPFILHLN